MAHRCPSSNFASLDNLHHPARCLLRLYAHRGAPVKFAMPLWTCQHLQHALSQGLHRSSLEYIDFLQEEFVDMINKGWWVILPVKAVLHLPGLQLSPPGVVPPCGRRPRWICDYSCWGSTKTPSPSLQQKQCNLVGPLNKSSVKSSSPTQPMDISDSFYPPQH